MNKREVVQKFLSSIDNLHEVWVGEIDNLDLTPKERKALIDLARGELSDKSALFIKEIVEADYIGDHEMDEAFPDEPEYKILTDEDGKKYKVVEILDEDE